MSAADVVVTTCTGDSEGDCKSATREPLTLKRDRVSEKKLPFYRARTSVRVSKDCVESRDLLSVCSILNQPEGRLGLAEGGRASLPILPVT